MTSPADFAAAANAIALAAWKLLHAVETAEPWQLTDEVLDQAAELRAISSEWVPGFAAMLPAA